ncbi:hypothetical protein GCM10010363_68380 [Streptomyces omiyaensis]|nr:hypothetical protein GCM10010363_68380 [Streptomyces omiyaensis]
MDGGLVGRGLRPGRGLDLFAYGIRHGAIVGRRRGDGRLEGGPGTRPGRAAPAARPPSCPAAGLPRHPTVRPSDFPTVRLPDSPTVRRPGFPAAPLSAFRDG